MSSRSPGIVLASSFVSSTDEKFQKYVEYIDRDEATRNQAFEKYNIVSFHEFNDYMENPVKSTGLFSATENYLDEEKREQMKHVFEEAQKNQSTLWQDVFSFDNAFLEEEGLYDRKSGQLEETKIQQAVRVAMEEKFKREGLSDGGVWTASIHYNTDNIHVHVASIEMKNTKPRVYREVKHFNKDTQKYEGTGKWEWQNKGRVKQSTLDKVKSSFANSLIDRNQSLKKIHELSRNHLLKNTIHLSKEDKQLCQMYRDLLKALPQNKKNWDYNRTEMKSYHKQIDQITRYYLQEKNPKAYQELDKALTAEEEKRIRIYGDGTGRKKAVHPDIQIAQAAVDSFHYKENKWKELYERAGNKILHELKGMTKDDRADLFKAAAIPNVQENKQERTGFSPPTPFKKMAFNEKLILRNMKKLEKIVTNERETMQNEHAYEELQQQIYMTNQRQGGR